MRGLGARHEITSSHRGRANDREARSEDEDVYGEYDESERRSIAVVQPAECRGYFVAGPYPLFPPERESSRFPAILPFPEENVIRGVHTMFYSSKPDALRAFLKDKLRFPATDVGNGWLIFDLPESDMGCHPADAANGAPSGTHDVSFYCDDIVKTVKELEARGVKFTGPVEDHGYGLVTHFLMPGEIEVQLYEPRYTKKAKKT